MSWRRVTMTEHITDRFGRVHDYLRLSLTDRCNLRCTYCMPSEGVELAPRASYLTDDELVRLAGLFVRLGVKKIRLTGGEPLVRKGAVDVIARLGALPGLETLSITTNGVLLADRLDVLVASGMKEFNLSLDTLDAELFARMTLRQRFEPVRAALDALLELAGRDPDVRVKINCVAMVDHNESSLATLAALSIDHPIEVRFIEYMPFHGNRWDRSRLVSMDDIVGYVEAEHGALEPIASHPSSTAKRWRLSGARGTVGVIASMTTPFCAACNRVRVTADGAFKVCLFGEAEVSLRDAMRQGALTDDELAVVIRRALGAKHEAHAGLDVLAELPNRPMITIGG